MNILCPTDHTLATDVALVYAGHIASKGAGKVTLFHVLNRNDANAKAHAQTLEQLTAMGAHVVEVERKGDPQQEIIAEAGKGYALMVAGTHGVQTLKEELLGSNMLKLVRHVHIPTLVVQRHSSRTVDLGRILMPVAGHEDITPLLDAVCMLAKQQGSEVIIYQQLTEGDATSNSLLINKVKMLDRLKKEGIAPSEVNEPVGNFYKGFAERTLRYARDNSVNCIAIMAKASNDLRKIADEDKQELLTNKTGIPVLCAV